MPSSTDRQSQEKPRNLKHSLSWALVYFGFYLYRCFYSVIGEVVVMGLTPISDTASYQRSRIVTAWTDINETIRAPDLLMQDTSTAITKLLGGILGAISGYEPITANIGFQTVGFIGLVVLLEAVPPRHRVLFLLVLMLPSFTLWSSIASKEAIVVGLLGILMAFSFRLYQGKKNNLLVLVIATILLFMFKPHFMIPFVFLYGSLVCGKYVKQKATMALFAFGLSLAFLYFFRFEVDVFSRATDWGLTAMGGRSVRPLFLANEWDTYYKAPLGMFLAFIGPTLGEASRSVLHLLSFIESIALLVALIIALLWRLPSLPVFSFVLVMGTTFWAMFTNFPLGVSNPGTAIRYRTDWILFLLVGFFLLLSRDRYVAWIETRSPPKKKAPE